jgi:hypothetical protein
MKIEKIDNQIYLDGKKIKNNYLPTNETNLYVITEFIAKEMCRYLLADIGGEDPSLDVVISEEKNSYTVIIAKMEVQKGNKKHFLNFDKNSSFGEIKKSIQDFKIEIMGEL